MKEKRNITIIDKKQIPSEEQSEESEVSTAGELMWQNLRVCAYAL